MKPTIKGLGDGSPEPSTILATMSRFRIAIELGPRRLRGVAVTFVGSGLQVVAAIAKNRPELGVEAVGEWIRGVLDANDIPAGRCLLAVSRDDVVIKRLMLETPSKGELPAMVDIAMRDELHLEGGAAVIDFLTDSISPIDGSTSVHAPVETNLLAAALPASSLDRGRSRMAAAKRPVARMSLRLLGAAHLAADPHGGRVACIDVSGDGVEFTLLQGTDVRVARAAALPVQNPAEVADAATREARRTWMSWQAEAGTASIDRVVLIGDSSITDPMLEAMGEITAAPITVLREHLRIDRNGHDVSRLWALLGLLLADHAGKPLIDFIAPRKPTHRFERRRQLGLAAAGVLLVIFGVIWTWGNSSVQTMQRQLDAINAQRAKLEPKWLRYHRDRYRLANLDIWTSVQPDWVEHLAVAVDRLQPIGVLVLDEVSAALEYKGIDVPKKGGVGAWKPEVTARLVLEAEAQSRDVGEAFRQRWVEDEAWNVATTGADTDDGKRLPFGVTIRLHAPTEPEATMPEPEATP